MSGYLGGGGGGGGGGGVTPGDLYQDWANILLVGAIWDNTTTNTWLTGPALTYLVSGKSNSWSYGTSSVLTIPVTGTWRIHLRASIINNGIDMLYGLSIGGTYVFFSVATGGSNLRQGNDTLIHNCTAGQIVVPAIYQLGVGTVTWNFNVGTSIYLELLKPAV